MVTPNWDLPLPNYDKDVKEIVRTYKSAIREVILILEELSTYGKEKDISRQQMKSVIVQLSVFLKELDNEAESWVTKKIEEAFKNGQAESIIADGKAKTIEEAVKLATISGLARTTIEVLIADTFEDLLYANNKMKRETIKMVRTIVAEQMRIKAAQGMGRRTTRKAIEEALTKKEIRERFNIEGNIAIVDKAGRRWKLETYTEMVVRTKMLQAHVEGTRIEALQRGIDLAIISSHGATDACRNFEGQIISLNGQTEGFLTYNQLRASNLIFHPNCRHKVTPIRDISLLPKEVRERFEKGRDRAFESFEKIKNK